jgi:hypothetical protein
VVDYIHLMIYFFIFCCTFYQSLIGILKHLIDVSHIVHFLFHLYQQLLLGIPKLFRFGLDIFKCLFQLFSKLIMLSHN